MSTHISPVAVIRRFALLTTLLAVSCFGVMTIVDAQNGHGGQTRLLRSPRQLNTNRIRVREQYLGRPARRRQRTPPHASFQGQTANPHFSPDGRWIAFSGMPGISTCTSCRVKAASRNV